MGLGAKLSEEPYSSEDRDLLVTVSHHVALALENAELLEVARREAQLSRDVEIARDIQRRLFPSSLPKMPGWEFAGRCIPAGQVGGDYYDIFEVDSHNIVLSLGDVSGKGLGASFIMSSVHAAIRTKKVMLLQDPVSVLEELNTYLMDSTTLATFVSLFLAVLDTRNGAMRYVNCGHPPALVFRMGSRDVRYLSEGSTLLGCFPRIAIGIGETRLEPGDIIVVYSDGVTEAMDRTERQFGLDLLSQAVRESSEVAEALMARILSDIAIFRGEAEQSDDISLITAIHLAD
jgi:sigma-B regulation protein RsbU (phosphoserine phosphatase)